MYKQKKKKKLADKPTTPSFCKENPFLKNQRHCECNQNLISDSCYPTPSHPCESFRHAQCHFFDRIRSDDLICNHFLMDKKKTTKYFKFKESYTKSNI